MGNTASRPTLEARRDALFAGALKNVRSAALAAALVPVALIAAQPTVAYAQDPCDPSSGCSTVPEPATLLLLAPAAAGLMWRQRRNGKT